MILSSKTTWPISIFKFIDIYLNVLVLWYVALSVIPDIDRIWTNSSLWLCLEIIMQCPSNLAFLPDTIHHCYAYVFYGPQQVFVCNEIPGTRGVIFETLSLAPPYGTTVGSSDVLGEMVKKNSVDPEKNHDSHCSWLNEGGTIMRVGKFDQMKIVYLLYQSRTDWMSSSSWLILRRKSPCRICKRYFTLDLRSNKFQVLGLTFTSWLVLVSLSYAKLVITYQVQVLTW